MSYDALAFTRMLVKYLSRQQIFIALSLQTCFERNLYVEKFIITAGLLLQFTYKKKETAIGL